MKRKAGALNIFRGSGMLSNSFWGLLSTLFQTLFLSAFFIILSHHYLVADFANFIVANTVYQLIVGFSSMGLGHWFIREYGHETNDRETLVYRFVKVQTYLGLLFYVINVGLAYIIYPDHQVRMLAIVLGTNIVFDNVLYALKNLNIAQFQQRKTAVILAVDGFLRLAVSCILFFYPLSLIYLSVLLVVIRLLTVNIFIQIGADGSIGLRRLLGFKVTPADFKKNVLMNWKFLLIVGSAIIFWRSATIIISKFLSPADVANYEIAFKIFSIFTMLSIVASSTVYPNFVKFMAANNHDDVRRLYTVVSFGYTIFAIGSYAFIQSYARLIIPLIFDSQYLSAADCLKLMFLTILVFPTVYLQANMLVAMGKEKIDMQLNFLALVLNIAGCLIGLHYYKSTVVINYSVFGAFLVFHIAQNILLIRFKIGVVKNALSFYALVGVFIFAYGYLVSRFNTTIVFVAFVAVVIAPLAYIFYGMMTEYLQANKLKAGPAAVDAGLEDVVL